jgi:hypothetical protein
MGGLLGRSGDWMRAIIKLSHTPFPLKKLLVYNKIFFVPRKIKMLKKNGGIASMYSLDFSISFNYNSTS